MRQYGSTSWGRTLPSASLRRFPPLATTLPSSLHLTYPHYSVHSASLRPLRSETSHPRSSETLSSGASLQYLLVRLQSGFLLVPRSSLSSPLRGRVRFGLSSYLVGPTRSREAPRRMRHALLVSPPSLPPHSLLAFGSPSLVSSIQPSSSNLLGPLASSGFPPSLLNPSCCVSRVVAGS